MQAYLAWRNGALSHEQTTLFSHSLCSRNMTLRWLTKMLWNEKGGFLESPPFIRSAKCCSSAFVDLFYSELHTESGWEISLCWLERPDPRVNLLLACRRRAQQDGMSFQSEVVKEAKELTGIGWEIHSRTRRKFYQCRALFKERLWSSKVNHQRVSRLSWLLLEVKRFSPWRL